MKAVAGIGELLWDEFPDCRRLGGAPVNFTCHCSQLGAQGVLIGCVGRDTAGDDLLRAVTELGIDVDCVQRDAEAPTGIVQVTLDDRSVPSYTIAQGVAWDAIRLTAALQELAPTLDAVCFGSLAQRSPTSMATIHAFLSLCRPDALKIFDVNLRQQFFSKPLIERSLNAATVLKVSDEELPVLADMFDLAGSATEQLRQLITRYDLRLAACTMGCDGSLLVTADAAVPHPICEAAVVDTVGAGDSFTAALCMGLLNGDSLETIGRHANAVAAFVCTRNGATPELPAGLVGADRASGNLLEIRDLSIAFHTDDGVVPAVSRVSFVVPARKTVALLGESGCGKSVTARAIMNFIDAPGRLDGGEIRLWRNDGWVDLLQLDSDSDETRAIRWKEIAMIFQDPMNSLTPAYTVGDQIIEAIRLHEDVTEAEARRRAIDLLREVGVPAPERRVDDYPHQMSGGMCQRAMIAMALSCNPRLIIADEPTTALDVTIQAQVLELLKKMQRVHDASVLLITHDMGVVAEIADEVVVMYLGRIVEKGSVEDVFNNPRHPYTQRLFASVPRPDLDRSTPLPSIPGTVPDHLHIPEGCPFRGRCHEEMRICKRDPRLKAVAPDHETACWLYEEDDA